MSLKKKLHTMSIMTLSENALLGGVVRLLQDREIFRDNKDENERIFEGGVFEDIGGELAEIAELNPKSSLLPSQEVIDQIDELAELISADYFMLTMS